MSRLDLSHHREHKFKHSFQDTLNALVDSLDVDTASHYFLYCASVSVPSMMYFPEHYECNW